MSSAEYERQKRYMSKQKEKGLGKVCVWVPTDKRSQLIEFADSLCENPVQENERNRSDTLPA